MGARTGAAFARGTEVSRVRSRADHDGGAAVLVSRGCSPGASGITGLAAAARRLARVELTREFEPGVAAGVGVRERAAHGGATCTTFWPRRVRGGFRIPERQLACRTGPNRPRVEPALGCEPFVAAVAWRVPAERGVAQGGVTRSPTGRA